MVKQFFRIALFVTLFASVSLAQLFEQPDIVKVDLLAAQNKIQPGIKMDLAIRVTIDPAYHINSNTPTDEFLIPTEIRFEPVYAASFGQIIFPKAKLARFGFSDQDLSVFAGTITIFSDLTTAPDFDQDTVKISATFSYQACNDQVCLAPAEKKLMLAVPVAAATEVPIPSHEQIFAAKSQISAATASAATTLTADELRAQRIIERGLPYAIMAFFLIGLALNLTPCVYPVIPITVSFFGGQSGQKSGSPFFKALAYVIGIALVFSILGLISGLAGKQWGFLFQTPWFVIVIGIIILVMAASLFGAFEITIPSALMTKLGSSREGALGAFIMGLTVGIVIAPCAAGIIIGLVGLVAKLGIVVKGTLLFFVMGLGLGLPYLILATFSGLLNRLPQSGMWMVWIRKLFALLLIGVAIYFLLPQLSRANDPLGAWLGVLGIFAGLLLGFLDHAPGYSKGFKLGRGIFGILVIIASAWLTQQALFARAPEIVWQKYQGETLESYLQSGKPVFIDFYADWCAPCKELDKKTFTDERVIAEAKNFTMIKVDCTLPNAATRSFMERFQVVGMPTLIFLKPDGQELGQLRGIGFIGPDDFLRQMQTVLQTR